MSDAEVVIESHLVELEAMGFTIVNDVRIVEASELTRGDTYPPRYPGPASHALACGT